MRSGTRLAIDVGSTRIGVARCDPGGMLASPLATVRQGAGELAAIASLVAEHEPLEVIVGLPTGLSGLAGPAAVRATAFAASLAAKIAPVPVRLADERFTTVLAHSALREAGRDSRARRPVIDQAAAAVLLQSVLDAERSSGDPLGELVDPEPGGGA